MARPSKAASASQRQLRISRPSSFTYFNIFPSVKFCGSPTPEARLQHHRPDAKGECSGLKRFGRCSRRSPPPWSVDDTDTKLGQDCYIVRGLRTRLASISRTRRGAVKMLTRTRRSASPPNVGKSFQMCRRARSSCAPYCTILARRRANSALLQYSRKSQP
jgi:hypothetical protein